MKAATMYYDSYDSDSGQFETVYIFSSIIGCIFWMTVIYCCIRGCRKTAERPQVVQVVQGEQQPQIHYVIHQDAMGPDGCPLPSVDANGRPIAYQQVQPGQFVSTTAVYAPPTAVVAVAQPTTSKEPVSSQNIV